MTGIRAWFDGRSLREKRMILVMLALAVLTLAWAAVVRPVRDGLANARERQFGAVMRLGRTEAAVGSIKSAAKSRPLTGPLADIVRARADSAGFTLTTLDEQGQGRVHTTIQAARPAALTQWLAGLEQSGVIVDAATLRDNGDRSVGADLVLKARAQ